jgi:pimeloyl-ACP methyl ester carboxylesterase
VDAEDIAEVLGRGAHLVGHSYGGLGCLLAAASGSRSWRHSDSNPATPGSSPGRR